MRGDLALLVFLLFSQYIHGHAFSSSAGLGSAVSAPPSDGGISISHLNVLLPYVERAAHGASSSLSSPFGLEIEVSGGCFQWFVTNPEVARLEPRYDERGCSQQALVSASSAFPERKTTWIHAEEIKTGKVLRCEVDVDLIDRIEIISTTRTMFKEDVEVLSIQAFDSQGNWFSTLSGVEFVWSLSPLGRHTVVNRSSTTDDGDDASATAEGAASLKFVPFSGSTVETDPVVLDMESQGKGAAVALVQGRHTGRSRVTATLAESGYGQVQAASIVMSVLEPLQIHPFHTVYTTRQSKIDYQLRTFKRDKYEVVAMPCAHYLWYSSAPHVGTVTPSGVFAAVELGKTELSVLSADLAEHQATVHVVVVEPAALQLTSVSVAPAPGIVDMQLVQQEAVESQYFITDRQYLFVLDLLDGQGHKLTFTPSLFSVQWSFVAKSPPASTALPRSPMSCNATNAMRIVCTTPPQAIDIRVHVSVIRSIASSLPPLELTLVHDLHVGHPVAVAPALVVLPYDASVRHSYTLTASNGSGSYQWSTGDVQLLALSPDRSSPYSATALVTTYTAADSVGQTFVRAVDSRNPDNRAAIVVVSAPPAAVAFAPGAVQVQVGRPLQLPLALFDAHQRLFSNCSRLPLTWILSDPSVFAVVHDDNDASASSSSSCTTKTLFALREGHSDVTVHYTADGSGGGLSAKLAVSAYEPLLLRTQLGRPDHVLLSPGASVELEFSGGPAPLAANPALYSAVMHAEQPGAVRIEQLPAKRLPGVFRVVCLTAHEQTLHFAVGNAASPSCNPVPVRSTLNVTLACRPPAQLVLSAPRADAELPKCTAPLHVGPLQILVDNAAPVDLVLRVQDQHGDTFDNVSTAERQQLVWSSSPPTLARLESASSRAFHGGEFYRQLLPGSTSGDVVVSASLPRKSGHLTGQLAVSLVHDVSLADERTSLYNHVDNVALLEIYGGSGAGYRVVANASGSVDASVSATAVKVRPLAPGTTRLTLFDPCLAGSLPAQTVVHVSYVGSLAVAGMDVIAAGSTGTLQIVAFDDRGARFSSAADYQFMRFDVRLDAALSHCCELVAAAPSSSSSSSSAAAAADGSRARFTVLGRSACSGFVTVSSVEPGRAAVHSEPFLLHVFDPFRLVPSAITLLAGSRFQPLHVDGPPTRTTVTFELVSNTSTSLPLPSVDTSTGMIDVPAGCALRAFTVVATVRVDDTVFGVDTLAVTVIDGLRALRLVVPSHELFVGGEMTVRVEGEQADETPFVFASQPRDYLWTSSNSEVGALLPLDRLLSGGDFSVRLQARHAGYTRVGVRALGLDSPSVLVRVREPLQLRTPGRLLLAPGAVYTVRTNKDGERQLHYSVLGGDARLLSCSDDGVVAVNSSASVGGHASVLIVDGATGTAESVLVSVGLVHSMQVLPPAAGMFIPVGSSLELQVVFRDVHGRVFDGQPPVQVRVHTNVQEVVAVQASTGNRTALTVTALQLGEVVLRVSVDGPFFDAAFDDYVRIAVSTAIEPVTPVVHSGGEIAFRIASRSNASHGDGDWSSDKDSVLTVDRSSGRALARSVGDSTVYHNGSGVFTYTRVQVVQPSQLLVDPLHAVPFVSNAHGQSYDFVVRALTAANVPLVDSPPAVRHNLVVRCSVLESQWAVVQTIGAAASSSAGAATSAQPGCRLRPLSPTSLPQPATPPANLTLVVTVTDRLDSYKLTRSHLVPLRSSFSLSHGTAQDQRDRIQLDGSRKAATVQVSNYDAQSLLVSSSNTDSVKIDNRGHGVFQLLRGHAPNHNVVVEFRDVVTGQVERLYVDVVPEESFYASSLASLTQSVIATADNDAASSPPPAAAAVPAPSHSAERAPPATFLGMTLVQIVVVSLVITLTVVFVPSLRPQRLFSGGSKQPPAITRASRAFETPRKRTPPPAQPIFSPGYDDEDDDDFADDTDISNSSHWIRS